MIQGQNPLIGYNNFYYFFSYSRSVIMLSRLGKLDSYLSSILLLTLVLSSLNNIDIASGQIYTNEVTIFISGLPPFYETKVYVNDTFVDHLTGGDSITIGFNQSTKVSVEPYLPSGYPYQPWPSHGMHVGFEGVSFACYPDSKIFNSNTTFTFQYRPLYFLLVTSAHGSARGTGWHLAGMWAPITVMEPDEDSGDTKYSFDHWSGGLFRGDSSEASNAVLMDGPKTITANWNNQHYLSLDSEYGRPTGSGWYDEDSTAEISVETPLEIEPDSRVVFVEWTGDHDGSEPRSSVFIDRPKRITANWNKQYYLSVNPNGGELIQESQWVDSNEFIDITAISPSNLVINESRLIFDRWVEFPNERSPTLTVLMEEPQTVTANWNKQYYLNIVSPVGDVNGDGWYDEGSVAEISVSSRYVPMDFFGIFGLGYDFSHWSGDVVTRTPTASLLINGPKNVEAVWKLSFIRFVILSIIIILAIVLVLWKREHIAKLLRKDKKSTKRKRK
jgi:hypothetical protein